MEQDNNEALHQFYADIITTGIEENGWVCSWAQLSRYGFASCETSDDVIVDIIALAEGGVDGYECPITINIDTIEDAFDMLFEAMKSYKKDDIGLSSDYVGSIISARMNLDAGEIDTELASYITQLGVFGKVHYS